jgi:membrane protease YdiL (CAAX protease family)
VLLSVILGFDADYIFGLRFSFLVKPGLWILSMGIGLILAVVSFFASRSSKNLREFPQISDRKWTSGLVFQNVLSWIVYLIAYEFLFRGLLLFPLVPVIGFWPAAVIGTVLYSLSHYPKSFREALGAIPFGIILAYLAWETQSVWPCFFIHVCMAVSNSLFSLYYHPDIQIVKSGK